MSEGLIWSFVLSAIGIVGILLAGSKYKVGWLLGFFVQPLWIVFAIQTEQYGFILNAVIYAAVYARNWLRWRREEREARSWLPWERKEAALRREFAQQPVEHRHAPIIREAAPKPPTVGPKGGAGDSGAAQP
jgi:nicotinamide riboside transporter PnuC